MCPHGYYTLLRESEDPRHLQLRMVQHAKRHGVKPAARAFGVQPRIVRKWLGRIVRFNREKIDEWLKARSCGGRRTIADLS
jgi:hypothetical protein